MTLARYPGLQAAATRIEHVRGLEVLIIKRHDRKLGALDQAAPLAGWELPKAFYTLRRERRLPRLQKQLANHNPLIIDELGFVSLSKTGAELLFEVLPQRYGRASVLITSTQAHVPGLHHPRRARVGHEP